MESEFTVESAKKALHIMEHQVVSRKIVKAAIVARKAHNAKVALTFKTNDGLEAANARADRAGQFLTDYIQMLNKHLD